MLFTYIKTRHDSVKIFHTGACTLRYRQGIFIKFMSLDVEWFMKTVRTQKRSELLVAKEEEVV
jgi:hypothetical protein